MFRSIKIMVHQHSPQDKKHPHAESRVRFLNFFLQRVVIFFVHCCHELLVSVYTNSTVPLTALKQ